MKLAVIGGGPSAFYAASRILSLLPKQSVNIHIYDRLWAPHGLVRYGVAPDHPEVKNCVHKFDEVAMDPRLRFFGNVEISAGRPSGMIPHNMHLPMSSILSNYTHLLFASGCTLPTLHPALPPSSYCMPALSLVHWYTQYPSLPPSPPLEDVSHVSIIGAGNVSLDVARMLLCPPSHLDPYDVPQPVMSLLTRSAVKHVSIIARRGPLEAAFTTKELRELMSLPNASMQPLDPALFEPLQYMKLSRQQTRMMDVLKKGSKSPWGSTPRTWSLDFFRAPTGLALPPSESTRRTPAELTLAHTKLIPDPEQPSIMRAASTGETSRLSTSLVVTSLGFRADPTPFPGLYDPASAHLRVNAGRIVTASGKAFKNVYSSGWAAMGARGVLAATMMDAYAVAEVIVSDLMGSVGDVKTTAVTPDTKLGDAAEMREEVWNLNEKPVDMKQPPEEVLQGLAENKIITYADWKKIDAEEVKKGKALGKERERMTWDEVNYMLKT
ncbi:FAD/NAD(P)-binding domain-containing protein [Dendrothele bispora CBS 962.96]|uniref:FAD/NAD(P)-binding domain-containing protein n=1 Tax=Dendrothele bispora (strain CBS 962.96) TaxID=1314807 RepID=A0A4V4HHI0_DENBC|nr:FAD/NAD(P)-binding domain-containing protein [Dendrothele bispora CBS 962.96]